MIKRILIITAIAYAMICAGWAEGGWGANEDQSGGSGVCHAYGGGMVSWNGTAWVVIAPC